MLARDHQDVYRSLGIDVTESNGKLTFEDNVRRDVTGGDAAKETVRHGGILTCAPSSRPLTYMVTVLRTHDAPPLWCGLAMALAFRCPGCAACGCRGDAMRSRNGRAWGKCKR